MWRNNMAVRRGLLLSLVALNFCGCSSFLMSGGGGTYAADASGERSSTELARDSAITAEVRAGHRNDPVVSAFEVGVRTNGGTVTLTGTVGSYEARNRAYRIARKVDGVSAVVNQVRVEDRTN